jgi:hypothetical protein
MTMESGAESAAGAETGAVRLDSRTAWQMVAGEVIVLDLASGAALGLNELGSFIWSRLETQSQDEIVAGIVREYDVDEPSARTDLAEFLRLLAERKLVTLIESGA